MSNSREVYWQSVKWIFKYLKGNSKYCLCFGGDNIYVWGYVGSDHGGDRDNDWSIIGYIFILGGTIISWVSKIYKIDVL